MMNRPLLEAIDLMVGYGIPVVGPLSFAVHAGEVLGLWGANGTGKSTLLKAISNGSRIFSGRLVRRPGLTVAYQAQRPVHLAEMPLTGRELLRYAQADREPAPPRLAPWLGRRLDTLSGGQYQLLAVWAVLATATDLVLLDEPTNNLDPEAEAILVSILAGAQKRRAVLLVSHEQAFLERACSRVLQIG